MLLSQTPSEKYFFTFRKIMTKENSFNSSPYHTDWNRPNYAGLIKEMLGGEIIGARTIKRLTSVGQGSSLALTDARAIKNQENEIVGIGFQKAYFGLLPPAVDVRMVWLGQRITNESGKKQADTAFAVKLKEPEGETERRHKAVLITGGEHLHPDTVGSHGEEVNAEGAAQYGGYDIVRDYITMGLIQYADKNDLALIAVCRGMQGAISYYSRNVAKEDRIFPRDHKQDEHSFRKDISHDNGKVMNRHSVANILYGDGVDYKGYQGPPINVEIPKIEEVNSVHEQGYRRCDISKAAMTELNRNGVYPWLVANVDGVPYEEQVYEGWLIIKKTSDGMGGNVTGVLTQFHPEQQAFDIPDLMRMRLFMQDIIDNHQPKRSDMVPAA